MKTKFCMESNITKESIQISLSEAKIKHIWTKQIKPKVLEGEDPPSQEELQRDQELEDAEYMTMIHKYLILETKV